MSEQTGEIVPGFYRCPTCGATREIAARAGQRLNTADLPMSVPCGWRGCTDRAFSSRRRRNE